MRRYTICQVDSFTDQLFKGNPAGVVVDADGLSENEMLHIARELNNSETAFVLSPTSPNHEVWLRFFTPTTEVPLCGHATIAAHYVRARKLNISSTSLLQRTGAGVLPLEICKQDGDYEIVMTQGALEFSQPFSGETGQNIISALGLQSSELLEKCPLQIVSAGHSKVMIGIRSRQCLNSMTPDYAALTTLSGTIGCNGFFVFTFDSADDCLTQGRMFAPAIGIQEDPVTGNANGPLGAYLVYNKLVEFKANGTFEFFGGQGEAMGRYGRVRVMVDVEAGKPVTTKVGGRAIIVFETEIVLP